MEIIKGYDIHPDNYLKPTPKWLRITADVLVFIVMAYDFFNVFLNTMPDFPNKEWVLWLISGVILLFKFLTKLITEKKTT
jgi:hypothetical protein